MLSMEPPVTSVYKHYRGDLYRVLATDAQLESAPLVWHTIYVSLKDGRIWVRPTSEFLETVEFNGNWVLRFEAVHNI